MLQRLLIAEICTCVQVGKGELTPNDPWATPTVVIYGTDPNDLNKNATGYAQVSLTCLSLLYIHSCGSGIVPFESIWLFM